MHIFEKTLCTDLYVKKIKRCGAIQIKINTNGNYEFIQMTSICIICTLLHLIYWFICLDIGNND